MPKVKAMSPISSVAAGNVYPMDYRRRDGDQATVRVELSGGASLTYTVEATNDDVQAADFDASTADWYDHDTLVDQTASAVGNIEYSPTGIRSNVTAHTTGSATLKIVPTA